MGTMTPEEVSVRLLVVLKTAAGRLSSDHDIDQPTLILGMGDAVAELLAMAHPEIQDELRRRVIARLSQ